MSFQDSFNPIYLLSPQRERIKPALRALQSFDMLRTNGIEGVRGGFLSGLFGLLLLFGPSVSHAEVCVWRNPERTMTRIFPEAGDYKTIIKAISGEKKGSIEKRLGATLDPGESKEWMYYEITDGKGGTPGYIIADAEKGEMGIIEIVMGITPDGKILGVYVQRARERDKEFKSDDFLKQFTGKNVKAHIQVGSDIKAAADSTSVRAVAFGVKKMLVFYDELKTERRKEDD